MDKYLVTGGAGFIGSNIVERLLNDGHKVRVVDNLSTGKFENIREFINDIEFICGDISDYKTAQKAVTGVDYIMHHAALPSVVLSIEDPVSVNESIVTATLNLFKASVESKTVKRIVQAVSAAAYGNSSGVPNKEDMLPDPISPYAVAKLTQEYYGKAFFNVYGLEVFSLRYFNVFGPKQDPKSFYSGVISIFTSQMLNGIQPVIFGDGLTTRDFVYIDNIVEANLLACKCKWPGKPEIINIGCGESITLKELVEMLNKILGTSFSVKYEKERIGDVRFSAADISNAGKILGYMPKVKVYEGLQNLVQWMKKQ
ncbi:MAG: NAD-dependent epimerase/dehydratase family protein [Clostridia bacterium]|nr:NAD-dependent epimerase/dehydratase family protein [Clostridia bacterium]